MRLSLPLPYFFQSLMELHKRRKTLTDPEARYLMKQIMFAVQYLHDVKVMSHSTHSKTI